ncbi:MAG: hypothetical protein AAF661_04930 [Pseudomonadota bacterium]
MISRRSVLGAVLATPTLAKTAAQSAAAPLPVHPPYSGEVAIDAPDVVSKGAMSPELEKLHATREALWRKRTHQRRREQLTPLRANIHDKRSWSNAFKVLCEIDERDKRDAAHDAEESALDRLFEAYHNPVGAIMKGRDPL